tara:strand:+ start:822 stop:1019 length:198 start_codon:yes stop_codon:yes gene_type:complete
MHRVSDKVWDYDLIDAERNADWGGIHKLVTDHAVEKRVTAEEIAKRKLSSIIIGRLTNDNSLDML